MDHPQTVIAEARTRVRAACSRQLAASERSADAVHALDRAIAELLPGRIGQLLRHDASGWHTWPADGVARPDGVAPPDGAARPDGADRPDGVAPPDGADQPGRATLTAGADLVAGCATALDAVLDTGRPHRARLRLRGQPTDVLLVPAGPASAVTVLALVSDHSEEVGRRAGSGALAEGARDGDGLDDQMAVALAAEAWSALRRIEVAGELDHAAQAAQHAAEEFQRRDRERADHVAGITHDLRSPVTAVLGFVRTLRKAGDLLTEEERREALEIIERQTLRMSRMLDDMLDSARAESGELVARRRLAVPLHLVVREAIAAVGTEQLPRLRPHLDADVTVCGDADQLARVAHNLLANAVAYAAGSGPVDVGVHREGGHGVLTVVDRGPGIPADTDVFARYGPGDVRGTGLGLYTVKRIVELHGGTIAMSTTPGGGTTVTVTVPCFDPDASA